MYSCGYLCFDAGVAVDGGVEVFASGGWRCGHAFEDVFGEKGDFSEGDAGGVLDGVEDGGGGAVHGQLAAAFGSGGTVYARRVFEVDVDGREVGGGGHDVVGHLVVAHEAVDVDAFFVERVADALRDAALDLALGEDGMDDLADFLKRVEVFDLGGVGERVDGDFRDVD